MTQPPRDGAGHPSTPLPLFPLRAVLYPGGLLALRIFEQRYVELTKACVRDGSPFGVCLLTQGDEVAGRDPEPVRFAAVGTLATIETWDMPELGIFHVRAAGGTRFEVLSHATRDDGWSLPTSRRSPPSPRPR